MANFTGCLLSKIDVRDYKIACTSKESLPDEYEIKFLPDVKNQKAVSSCVAHSTASILECFELLCGRKQKLSTNFIYGIQKAECGFFGPGMYLRDACKIVCKYGDMLEADCPGNTEVPDCWETANEALLDEKKKDKAAQFKIDTYFSCSSNDAIKKAILNYGPVLAAVQWYDSYKPDEQGVLDTAKVGEATGHAFFIYGWTKQGFKCQNSWGTSWGTKGRFIVPYAIPIREARCFVDKPDDSIIIPKRSVLLDIFYKLFNFILNIFNKNN